MSEPTELLPCPFCGGEANVIDHHNDDGSVSVGCNNDTCLGFSGLGWLYKTEAEAIEAWNTRTPVEYDGWFYLPKPKENIVQYGESEVVKTECGYKINQRVSVFESAIREWGDQLGEYVMKRVGEVFNPTETCELEISTDMTAIRCSKCGWKVPKKANLANINFCQKCGRRVQL